MLVMETNKWNFAYVLLPAVAGKPTKLVIPHALQMGWTESPPGYFCAATETGQEILQALIDGGTILLPPHVMDQFLTPEVPARRQTSPDSTQRKKWQMFGRLCRQLHYGRGGGPHQDSNPSSMGGPHGPAHYPWPLSCARTIRAPRWQGPNVLSAK